MFTNERRKVKEINWNDWFYYDETSKSSLRWKVDIMSGVNYSNFTVRAGDEAGSLTTKNYWQVCLHKRVYKIHRIIWQMHFGDIENDLIIDHFDRDSTNNSLCNLRLVPKFVNARNKNLLKNNKSGVTGVRIRTDRVGSLYWIAQCNTLEGVQYDKSFSVNRYGNEEAFRLACECRKKMLEELNKQGAGYTENHGT